MAELVGDAGGSLAAADACAEAPGDGLGELDSAAPACVDVAVEGSDDAAGVLDEDGDADAAVL